MGALPWNLSDNYRGDNVSAVLGGMANRVHSARLSDEVSEKLADWILAEKFAPGVQLPTEKTLCERFGVSRAVIREAISRLKADGCVTTRQGAGAFVAALPGEVSFRLAASGPVSQESFSRELSDVFELRYLMETGAAELAAMRRTAADLARMEVAMERMRRAVALGHDAVADDDEFHIAVAAATQNQQLARFQTFMGHQLTDSRVPTWNRAGHQAGRAGRAQQEHEQIYHAIASGDPVAARKAAEAHLVEAARRLGLDPMRWRVTELEEESK